MAARVRRSTFVSYRSNLRLHVLPTLGPVPIQAIEVDDLDHLYSELLRSGRSDGRGGLSPRTVRYIHTIVNRTLKDAMRWQLIETNVAALANAPNATETKPPPMATWTGPEVGTFLAAISEHRLLPLFTLAFSTGLRRGEICGLEWGDLSADKSRMRIQRSVVSVDYELVEHPPKTRSGIRQVSLDHRTIEELTRWKRQQSIERLGAGPAWLETGRIFTKQDGVGVHPDFVSKVFARVQDGVGPPRLTFHQIRHTWATIALRAGVNPKVVAERLGHSSIQVTLDAYTHVSPELDLAAAEAVAELMYG